MSSNLAVKVENISKVYKLYSRPVDRMKEALNPFKKKYHKDFFALKNVSFELKKGETLGIVGQNGAGKSTLLKILTGVLTPNEGNYFVRGKLASLLELGSGFNKELNGFENIYFNGTVLGFSKDEINKRLDGILEFADIGDFINQPIKTYSSGMKMRLAFSVAMSIRPKVLILDEIFAVGDLFFKAKCVEKMKEMVEAGVTLIFVSHSLESVKSLCDKALLLEGGCVKRIGPSKEVVTEYMNQSVAKRQEVVDEVDGNEKVLVEGVKPKGRKKRGKGGKDFHKRGIKDFCKRASFNRLQNGKAEFLNIQLLDDRDSLINQLHYGQEVKLRMLMQANENMDVLAFGYKIQTLRGVNIVNSNSFFENVYLENIKAGQKYVIEFAFRACLMRGEYNVETILSVPLDGGEFCVDYCDFVPCALQFKVSPSKENPLWGYVHWDNDLTLRKVD